MLHGAVDAHTIPGALAQGIAVQATSGASREDLHRVADQALSTWPSPESTTRPWPERALST